MDRVIGTDEQRASRQRAAYATYARLRHELGPRGSGRPGDPAYPALQEAVRRVLARPAPPPEVLAALAAAGHLAEGEPAPRGW